MIVDGKTVSTKVIKEREIDNMPAASSQENDNLENPPNKEIKNPQEDNKKEEDLKEKDEL